MFINKAGVKFKAFLYLFVGRFKLFGVVIVILSVYCNHKRTNKRKFCFTKNFVSLFSLDTVSKLLILHWCWPIIKSLKDIPEYRGIHFLSSGPILQKCSFKPSALRCSFVTEFWLSDLVGKFEASLIDFQTPLRSF